MKEKSVSRFTKWAIAALAVAAFAIALPEQARAQNSVGGHIGIVFPLVTHADGVTTTIADNFTVGFPMGITIKREGSKMAYDLEFVPAVQNDPRKVTLTVHPGLVWDLGHNFAGGIRAAFDVNQTSWGFTPLLAYGWAIKGHKNNKIFLEFDLPVRFAKPAPGDNVASVTAAIHLGTAF